MSSLNRGRYLKGFKFHLSKSSWKNLKGVRSATSIDTKFLKSYVESERNFFPEKKVIKNNDHDDLNEIICYYDLSEKYGIGYLLSNGNLGVIFNDQTSLTLLQKIDGQEETPSYLYYEKKVEVYEDLPEKLTKKALILKMCYDKLEPHKQKNILIPYRSHTFAKKWVPLSPGFSIKLSNSLLQFFWSSDSIALRNYKWLRWRVDGA